MTALPLGGRGAHMGTLHVHDLRKNAPKDLEGGTFTITNGGIYGSPQSTPIVNAPANGILRMHATQRRKRCQ
jgi:pyruvate/2-oxoglutarate dehydrogenase complex dihydrolipoamide acyltransferase (E2) component